VGTSQGRNFVVRQYTIPLYLKIARFVYRDMEYRQLVRQISAGSTGQEETVWRLYAWVRQHVHAGIPKPLPVMDDHVWSTIVRGYGTADQISDVLATLCVYAGIPAAAVNVSWDGEPHTYTITMIYTDRQWRIMDPYYGVAIRNHQDRLASVSEIRRDTDLVLRAVGTRLVRENYAQLYTHVPEISEWHDLRPYRHRPIHRMRYELWRTLAHARWSVGNR